MNKVFKDNTLTVTREDGAFIVMKVHPSTRKHWKSEEEALSFPITANFPFSKAQEEEVISEMSAFNFKLLFSPAERVAIKNSTDGLVKDFYGLLDDPRLETVKLDHPDTIEAVHYLASLGLIEPARTEQILSGQPR